MISRAAKEWMLHVYPSDLTRFQRPARVLLSVAFAQLVHGDPAIRERANKVLEKCTRKFKKHVSKSWRSETNSFQVYKTVTSNSQEQFAGIMFELDQFRDKEGEKCKAYVARVLLGMLSFCGERVSRRTGEKIFDLVLMELHTDTDLHDAFSLDSTCTAAHPAVAASTGRQDILHLAMQKLLCCLDSRFALHMVHQGKYIENVWGKSISQSAKDLIYACICSGAFIIEQQSRAHPQQRKLSLHEIERTMQFARVCEVMFSPTKRYKEAVLLLCWRVFEFIVNSAKAVGPFGEFSFDTLPTKVLLQRVLVALYSALGDNTLLTNREDILMKIQTFNDEMQDIGGVGVLENLYDEAISSIWSRVRLHLDQKSSELNAGHKKGTKVD
ncbi:hypothetical protein GUITHDRAFT_102700 [Guillardia theta CCMP2712]|uniref:Uncharacterized protein n=1 Tax=Guillardia theta (strain CCMP2712) TaxID=905079 RepID=L1JTM7_GUITC|nr:hypothetical protein GUITHDRAFT_102700 [Guillardia theta CCMP2712]EKX51433.1 hypothetical protein GUITHDRAFT_102700 [Guillardia theta CCMP2712]|eukprot:XP_005838413.1 hypothetical protein GUITHDRAFT_102700 [Guillardia theta CCMP2712]